MIKKLLKLDFSNFRGDLFGGITAGIVALPLALAFGLSSGLGPSAGLYGAIFISFFAAFFGGTPTQISGPTAPMTAVSMVFIADILSNFDGSISKALPIILAVFLLSGLLQIVLGLMGVGKYIRYIPYPVVSGFMTAIGVIILVTQIAPTVGYYVKEDNEFVENFIEKAESNLLQKSLADEITDEMLVLDNFESAIVNSNKITQDDIITEAKTLANKDASGVLGTFNILPRIIKNINITELLLALFTIAIIYGFKRITTVVPSTLVALFVVSGVAYGFEINYKPISAIPSGLPEIQYGIFKILDITLVAKYIFTAITLALLGAIDSLLTSIVADNMTKTIHEPNKELIGQGIGNSIGALQVAGTGSSAQIPFFVTACDYTLIGEEFFAASAYLSNEPELIGSLKGQDIAKLVAMISIIFFGILELFNFFGFIQFSSIKFLGA